MQLTKSGNNKFAGYQYFEIGDFMPQVNQIFSEIGLCGHITFQPDIASLCIADIEDLSQLYFQCPMAMASLKGCHEVQNLGASMTYIRRYLWVNALEIVEHDALDATTGKDKPNNITKPTVDESFKPDEEQVTYMLSVVDSIIANKADIPKCVDLFYQSKLDNEEKVWIWNKLQPYSTLRSAMKKHHEESKQKG